MREDLTFIAVVLDRSGSMATVLDDTIGGFNAFLEEQKKSREGQVLFTLVQFDDQYEIPVNGRLISDVPPLTKETYVPRGWTALYDAIGRTIDDVGSKLRAMPDSERPGKVVIMIQTDGHENRSRDYTRARVAEMIKHQKEKYDWDFVFIGASELAVKDAVAIGVSHDWAAQYSATPEGTSNIMRTASAGMLKYRSLGVGETKTNGFFAS